MMTDTDGLPTPRRYLAIAGVSLGITLAVIDSAIANVALPTIAADLNAEPADSIWVVNGYQLAITVSLLPLSSLGDRIGYRNIYIPGLVIFTLASLFCAMATSLPMLTLARVIQGVGAAGIMSVSPALLRFIYPQRLLGRGLGINALVVALAAAAGPTIASAILAFAPWPWLFAVNLPIGIAALVFAIPSLPATKNSTHKFDVISALLSAATFGLLIGSIDALGQGEGFGLFIAELAIGGILAWILTRRELGKPSPVLPVDLLRIPIPALTEDRRKDLVKTVRKCAEECKVAIRKHRRDANEMVDQLDKDGEVSQDDADRGKKKIEEVVAEGIKQVDTVGAAKEKDLLEV